jgi:hypothetical protein
MKRELSRTTLLTPRRTTMLGLLALLLGIGVAAVPVIAGEHEQANALVMRAHEELARGDRGAGVLDLERARAVAPRASSVRSALEAAAVEQPGTAVTRALELVTAREWALLATVLGWFAGLAFALAILRARSSTAWKVALGATVAFFGAMLGLARASKVATAVVVAQDARALVAPYADAAATGPLPAGLVVVRGSEHGDFVRVRTSHGLEGWADTKTLLPVARPSS